MAVFLSLSDELTPTHHILNTVNFIGGLYMKPPANVLRVHLFHPPIGASMSETVGPVLFLLRAFLQNGI
jgi:hypothetical protein